MGGLRQRIKAVETQLAKRLGKPLHRGPAPETAEQWLAAFEAMGRSGEFDGEPDFPKALAYYRDAVRSPTSGAYYRRAGRLRALSESCRGRSYVRVDGDGNVMPDGVDVSRGVLCRVVRAADEGWEWLAGMSLRILGGVPAVTEAEFLELTDWLGAVPRSMDEPTFHGGEIDLGTVCGASYQTTPANLWMSMRNGGPRALDAGEYAEAVRRLKARYGDGRAATIDAASNCPEQRMTANDPIG
jgi:hypothetical protein